MAERRWRDPDAGRPERALDVPRRLRRGLGALALLTSTMALAAPVPHASAAGGPLQVFYNGADFSSTIQASLQRARQEPARTYDVDDPTAGCSSASIGPGWSMATIVRAVGGDPARVTSFTVDRTSATGATPLSRSDVDPGTNPANPGGTDFPSGPAVVYPTDGGTFGFFRPLRALPCDGSDDNFDDWVPTGPVVVHITGGHSLTVREAASATAPQLQETITLSAWVGNRLGESLTYSWAFGDGRSATGLSTNTVTHAYGSAGTYHPTVTVTGSAGSSGTSSLTITVAKTTSPPTTVHHQPPPPPAKRGPVGSVSGQGTRPRPTAVGETTRNTATGAGPKPTKLPSGSTSRSTSKGSHQSPVPETATVRGVLLAGSTIADGPLGATTFGAATKPSLGGHGTTAATRVRDAVGRVAGVASVLAAVALFVGGGLSELDPGGRRWRRRRRKAVLA